MIDDVCVMFDYCSEMALGNFAKHPDGRHIHCLKEGIFSVGIRRKIRYEKVGSRGRLCVQQS